ncbi:hypothetical protein BVIR_943 [Blastochloris viridis]|uniref:Uncharacterized protein n=1 Tax=Blastochloris viridis TaxID=1079 RepID=A0A0N7IU95_BLAVI|nr:hypothetical protein BVIR_943 [Blastochloris viridis]CUU41395.1 hypothetical protein BVIRIDIS_03860 [Blastochloris viridis]
MFKLPPTSFSEKAAVGLSAAILFVPFFWM